MVHASGNCFAYFLKLRIAGASTAYSFCSSPTQPSANERGPRGGNYWHYDFAAPITTILFSVLAIWEDDCLHVTPKRASELELTDGVLAICAKTQSHWFL
jgi:hypothetical protein